MFICELCKVQTVNFEKLASVFDCTAKVDSTLRRIQRFVSNYNFSSNLIARFIFNLLPKKEGLKLTIDRTNWKFGSLDINIFMLRITYKGLAFPLLFTMLKKKGNSNCKELIDLINRFINLFGKRCIDCILADREFVGEECINF